MKSIALIGFMATGKTTIGKQLAQELGYSFIDSDQWVIQQEKMAISKIISTKGEKYFREVEKEAIASLAPHSNQVIATGGGAIIREENRQLLKEYCFVVSLSADPEKIYQRVKNDDVSTRPLINKANPLDEIRKLLEVRKEYYQDAHCRIDTTELTIREIINQVIDEYKKWGE